MAKITVLLGELSGSIAGNTYSRNKAGAYVRQKVTPTDRRSEAQINARATFAQTSAGFHTMTPLQKTQWNEFANTIFKPRDGRIPGVAYTGQQAYVALNQQLASARNRTRSAVFTAGDGDQNSGTGIISNSPRQFPPTSNFSGQLSVNSGPVNQSLSSVTYAASSGNFSAVIGLSGLGGGGTQISTDLSIQDPQTSAPIAYAFYGSDIVEQLGLSIPNPYKNLLMVALPPTTPISSTEGFTNFSIVSAAAVVNADGSRAQWYVSGNVMRVTCLAINCVTGQSQVIGAVDIVVS